VFESTYIEQEFREDIKDGIKKSTLEFRVNSIKEGLSAQNIN
jgi:hypothetical protein